MAGEGIDMSPEQQEARSCQYSAGVLVVPLKSGAFAIFQHGQFIETYLCSAASLAFCCQEASGRQVEARARRDQERADRAFASSGSSPLSAKDLGL